MADERDLVDVLVADHVELQSLLETISADPPSAEDEERLAVTIAELVRHLVVEEDYLYPVAREVVPECAVLVEEALAQSGTTERLAKQIEGSSPGDGHRAALLRTFSECVRHHVQTTESTLFPQLREHGTPGDLRRLAGEAEMAKTTAPTRPHPRAPKTQPWNQILTPGIGIVDRIRDAMTGRPNRPEQL